MAGYSSRRSRYGDAYTRGTHELGHHDKVDFKRREMQHELGHEDEQNRREASKPKLLGYYFYNVPMDDRDTAATYGIKQLKSGKWAMPIYDKSGASTAHRKRLADEIYGQGKWWSPNEKKVKEDGSSVGTVTQVSDKDVSFKDDKGIETKVPVNTGLFSKDEKTGQLTFNKAAALAAQGQKTGGQPQQQNQMAKPGEKIQINASVDNELDSIKKFAGL